MKDRFLKVSQIAIRALIISAMTASAMLCPAPNIQSTSTARALTGRVRGQLGERGISNHAVVIQGETDTYKVLTDKDGIYEAELPAGIYRITAEVESFHPFRRAAFRVRPGEVTIINISPNVRTTGVALSIDPKTGGFIDYYLREPPPKYDSFLPKSSVPLDLQIAFDKRRRRKGIIEYYSVSVTYDALTIYAEKARLNPKTLRLEAEGNVLVEDNKPRVRVRRAAVEFKAGEPTVTLTRGYIDAVRGEGAIDGGDITFKFEVKLDASGYLVYEDKKRSLKIVADRIDIFRTADDESNTVEFYGGGLMNGSRSVSFTIIAKDKATPGTGMDTFSIDHGPDHRLRTGVLSHGDIVVHRDF